MLSATLYCSLLLAISALLAFLGRSRLSALVFLASALPAFMMLQGVKAVSLWLGLACLIFMLAIAIRGVYTR